VHNDGRGVTYRRRSPENGGASFVKKLAKGQERIIDNRYVVPHNRLLTMLFGCHICVEFVTQRDVWFYLFKYTHKEDPAVNTALYRLDPNNPNVVDYNEFVRHKRLTYMGPYEAVDFIRAGMHAGSSHSVKMLSIHLPGQEPVYFERGFEDAAADRAFDEVFRTEWTAFHDLCAEFPEARKYKFTNVGRAYVFHKKIGKGKAAEKVYKWLPRQQGPAHDEYIAAIWPPNPNNRMLFATYLLANELLGIESIDDMCRLNVPSDPDYDPTQPTVQCESAIEAANRRGLLSDDTRWKNVMEQILNTTTNRSLLVRHFTNLLLHSRPSDPLALFNSYLERLLPRRVASRSNDYTIRMQTLLRQIQRQLRENNRTMEEFGLQVPAPDTRPLSAQMDDDLFPPTLDPITGEPIPDNPEELRRDAEAAYNSLNPSQKEVVDKILQMHHNLYNETDHDFGELIGHSFLLSGAAGTGKTYTLNTLIKMCPALRIPVFASASTGIAATRLTGATTAHSLFGIPITEKHSPKPTSSVTGDSYKGSLLKKVRIFIIDEIGMLPVDVIKAVDKLLCFLHNVPVSQFTQFGKTIIIFTGDQRQIMPVMGRGVDPLGDEQAEASFFFSNYNKPHLLTALELTLNMRLDPQATEFHRLQAAIGVDEVDHVAFPNDTVHQFTRYIEIPSWMARYNEMAFIREVFPPSVFNLPPMELIRRVILSSVNVDVDRINLIIVDMMPADRPSRNYLSTNVAGEHDVHNPENAIFSPEGMQNIVSPTLPYHLLTLKVGTPVMCMQNLDVPNGLANGAMMVVTRLEQDVVGHD
jgi:hypothetical protein